MSVVELTPEVRQVTAADVLNRAADLLEEFGWCQGRRGSKRIGAFCAVGATYAAENDLGLARESAVLVPALGQVGISIRRNRAGVAEADLGRWNDEPDRTKAEVVAKLREAASLA